MDGTSDLAPAFSYADVPAEHRDWLRRRAEDIEGLSYRVTCDLIRTGEVLAEVRAKVRRRTFRRWVAAELPFSRSWAYHLMKIGKAFGEHIKPGSAAVIDTRALVLLSSAPPGARAFAVERAAEGKRISEADAREIVAAHRPRPDPDRAAVRGYEAEVKPLRDAEKKDRQAAGPADDPGRKARAWEMVERLAGLGPLTLAPVDDDEDDGPAPFYVSALLPGGRRAATRRALADAVAAVLGEEDRRRCLGPCKADKPLGEFGENRLKKGGKNPYCKACERDRLGKLKRAAKAARRSAGA